MSGPPPKRSNQRRRANTPAAGEPRQVVDPFEVEIPEPDPEWHKAATLWFESLARSGQSVFYTNSDWAAAYVLAESISRELNPQPVVDEDGHVTMVSYPPKGASLAAWLKGMTALLVTEGDRRRAALELVRPDPAEGVPADVSELDEYRQRLRTS